jgi:hypothetical protein
LLCHYLGKHLPTSLKELGLAPLQQNQSLGEETVLLLDITQNITSSALFSLKITEEELCKIKTSNLIKLQMFRNRKT